MNDAVIPEIQLLLFSVLAGILCFLGYDLLLVLRAFLKRAVLFEKIEDVLYWGVASVLVFSMIHQKNSGVIRGYSIIGMLSGMILYRMVMKDRLVQKAQCLAKKIGKWGRKKLEPLRKKKKELQNKRKQIKIERKAKQQAAKEQKRALKEQKKRKKKKVKKRKKKKEQEKE